MNAGRTGKLDALAKCTLLETLDLSYCNGYDADGNKVSEGLTGTWHRSLTAEATSESCTDALTPKSCCAPPPSPGSLDPLANCTKLETLNLAYCKALTGTSSLVGPENDCSCI